jgi:ribonuclease HI
MTANNQLVTIYTDGACLGNPGPGGWAAILIYKEHQKKISGGQKDTTNNRMEMQAAIEAFRTLKKPSQITIYTDSKYVMDGITKWIIGWKKNGWRNANRQAVKNSDLWQELDAEVSRHKIQWNWVKGHAGNHFNEVVDELARKAAEAIR